MEEMDVVLSLLKISRELADLEDNYIRGKVNTPELLAHLRGSSWLIEYIAKALEVELAHAANRGRQQALKQLEQETNNQGQRVYPVMALDQLTGFPGADLTIAGMQQMEARRETEQ